MISGVRLSLWRAAAAFRVVTLAAALYLIGRWYELYAHPGWAVATGAGMTAVTAAIAWLAVTGRAHRWPVVAVDMALTAVLTLGTIPAQTAHQRHGDMPTLTTVLAGYWILTFTEALLGMAWALPL